MKFLKRLALPFYVPPLLFELVFTIFALMILPLLLFDISLPNSL
jgi:hypothetical protein